MGRQVRLYLQPADIGEVEALLRDRFDSVVLAARWPTADPVEFGPGSGLPFSRYICLRSMLPLVRPEYIEQQGYWHVNVSTNPVIEWHVPLARDGSLPPGRFYYVPRMIDGEMKDERFLAKAAELFSKVRKMTGWIDTAWGRERIGKAAAAEVAAGTLRLAATS